MRHLIATAAIAAGITFAGAAPAAATTPEAASGQYATFEGETIDLTQDRGDAVACAITDTGNRCYRSEAAMDRAEQHRRSAARAGSCSSSVRLYTGTGYSGNVTSIFATGTWVNLSTYGADNTTSSYRIGACSAAFRSGSFGTGSNYPGSTSAFSSSATMLSGWNNVVSSVRLS